jgi:hypothetical protein
VTDKNRWSSVVALNSLWANGSHYLLNAFSGSRDQQLPGGGAI